MVNFRNKYRDYRNKVSQRQNNKSIYEYLNNPAMWDRVILPLKEPMNRRGTPYKLASPFGIAKLKTRNLAKPLDSYKAKAGSVWRFNYNSIELDGSEHDPRPFIILLEKDIVGGLIHTSKTSNNPKTGITKYGEKYFYGLNLNYLTAEGVALILEAFVLQDKLQGRVTYHNIKAVEPKIPYHAFRMYYLKQTSGLTKVRIKRDGQQQKR